MDAPSSKNKTFHAVPLLQQPGFYAETEALGFTPKFDTLQRAATGSLGKTFLSLFIEFSYWDHTGLETSQETLQGNCMQSSVFIDPKNGKLYLYGKSDSRTRIKTITVEEQLNTKFVVMIPVLSESATTVQTALFYGVIRYEDIKDDLANCDQKTIAIRTVIKSGHLSTHPDCTMWFKFAKNGCKWSIVEMEAEIPTATWNEVITYEIRMHKTFRNPTKEDLLL